MIGLQFQGMGSKSKFGDKYGMFKCGQDKQRILGGHVRILMIHEHGSRVFFHFRIFLLMERKT